MKYLSLKEHIKLRDEGNKAVLFNEQVEYLNKRIVQITKSEYVFLQLLTGEYTENELVQIISQYKCIDLETVKTFVSLKIKKFSDWIEKSSYKKYRDNIVIKKEKKYEDLYDYKCIARLSAPLLISIVTTERCAAKCKYCFANAATEKEDILTTEDILKIIDEAKQIGVSSINITGGDPFTRADIFIIIKKLNDCNLFYNISTKIILNDNQIKKVYESGLSEIQLSIDSCDDAICEQLIGVKNYYSQMKIVIKKLKELNIKVKINIVATSINIESIPKLISELLEMNVDKIYVSPYLSSLGRSDDILLCSSEQHDKLNKALPKDNRIDYKRPNYEKTEFKNLDNIQICSGGKSGLVIYSDGSVGICERLVRGYLSLGNIKDKSIMEIWNSKELYEVVEPSKEMYKNTICYDCETFEECILKKGPCYVRNLMYTNNLYAPDLLCPKVNDRFKLF